MKKNLPKKPKTPANKENSSTLVWWNTITLAEFYDAHSFMTKEEFDKINNRIKINNR